MFIVLRKATVKRGLAVALLLILSGISLVRTGRAEAAESLFYLYPSPGNNPVSPNGLFWEEDCPQAGEFSLGYWNQVSNGEQIVIGIPQGYQLANAWMLGNNLGKYIAAKIPKKNPAGARAPKDSITYEREILPDSIKEKVKVEVGEHFKNNDNFEKYLDSIRKHLTNKDELPELKPKPEPKKGNSAQAVIIFGGTMILGGMALMAKILLPLMI